MSHEFQALQRHNPSGREGYGYGRQLGPPPGHVRDMDPSEALEPRRLLRSLFRRRWQILLVAALVLIPVTVATLLTRPEYVSAAMVEIEPEPAQVLPYREIDLPSLTPNYEMFMKSQEQMLRSPTLISRVAERLRADPSAETLRPEIPRLGSQFAVQRLENTQIFRLRYGAPDPGVAANLANMFAEEYIKRHYESRQETRKKANQFLQRELEELEKRVQESESNLVAYAQTHRLPAMEQPGQGVAPQKLSDLNQELTRAEGEVFLARARRAALQKASVEDFPDKLTTNLISGLVARSAQLENDLANLRATFGENWPAVIQKRGEITLVSEQIDREKSAALQQAREQASLDLAAAENRMRLVASSFTSQQATVNTLESASIQYNILRREVETNRKMYEGLLERLKQTSVTSGIDLGGFRIVEAARPSETPDSPRLWWNLLLASVLGLALGVCVALGRDYWDTSVSTVEEVEQLTVLPVLGSVPRVRPAATAGLFTWAGVGGSGGIVRAASSTALNLRNESPAAGRLPDDPALAESIRNVCASILLSRSGHPPRIIMVTSSVPAEGKTTIATELGEALADSGAKTLLVECDMRKPSLAERFHVGDEGGLSLFLAGHVGPTPTIHATASDNLFVVTAGPRPPNPPALLNSDKLRRFLRDMTSSFRFVIIDAPPVLPIADARILAPMTEGVVLVVRAGHASKHLIRKVCSMLQASGASVLGAVLNGADASGSAGSDYRYYRGYYGP